MSEEKDLENSMSGVNQFYDNYRGCAFVTLPPQTLILTDPLDIQAALKAKDMLSVFWNLRSYFWDKLEAGSGEDYEDALAHLNDLMEERNIDLEELYP